MLRMHPLERFFAPIHTALRIVRTNRQRPSNEHRERSDCIGWKPFAKRQRRHHRRVVYTRDVCGNGCRI